MSGKSTQPVNLTRVDVVGDKKSEISSKHMEKLLTPLLNSSDKTVSQLIKETNKTLENLQYSGLFRSVGVKLQNEKSGAAIVDSIGEDVLNVGAELDVELNKLTNYSVNSVHNNLGNAIGLAFDNKNLFENGESLKAVTILNKTEGLESNLIDFQFKTPMLNPSMKLVFNGLYEDNELSVFDSRQRTLGFQLGLEKQKFCKCSGVYNTITAGLSYHKRDVSDIKDNASDEIKAYAGDDVKQSFFLDGTITNMEYVPKSTKLPLNGMTIAFSNELAGMLATEDEDKFYKLAVDIQLAKSTPCKWITLTSGLSFGNILDLSNQENGTIHFQDKFYPVIPGTVLPLQPKTSLGGMSYASYNIGVLSKLGMKSVDSPIRAYGELRGGVSSNNAIPGCQEQWTHGVDFGVIYQSEIASARVFGKSKLNGFKTPVFGFEVSMDGDW